MPADLRWAYRRAYEALNYQLRSRAGGRFAAHCRPTSIIFLLTERCNARCLHCDIWKSKGGEQTATVGEWKTVLRDLRKWLGPVYAGFSGGEALLRPFTPELAAYGSSLGLFLEVLTHGYWKDQSRIEKLALANPWRITVSFDAVGNTHSKIRGREDFFQETSRSIETFVRLRRERNLTYQIRLKTVVMAHNLDQVCEVARFASRDGMHVFYQPIEQNYNTPEDPGWFERSANWPTDLEKVQAVVRELVRMKREGLHIANSYAQLEAMSAYFRDPAGLRVATQSHQAHERQLLCSALTMLQFQSNGDVKCCSSRGAIGNIRQNDIRSIWEQRPRWWETGCCLEKVIAPGDAN